MVEMAKPLVLDCSIEQWFFKTEEIDLDNFIQIAEALKYNQIVKEITIDHVIKGNKNYKKKKKKIGPAGVLKLAEALEINQTLSHLRLKVFLCEHYFYYPLFTHL